MARRQIEQIRLRDSKFPEVAERIRTDRKREGELEAAADDATRALTGQIGLESLDSNSGPAFMAHEAIILAEFRPAYFIKNGRIDLDGPTEGAQELVELIERNRAKLELACRSTARVDLIHHWNLPYAGTGWLLEDDLAVTNRHVAKVFAESSRLGPRFSTGRFGQSIEARLDYKREVGDETSDPRHRAEVLEILHIAGEREADIAFLRVRKLDSFEPIRLSSMRAEPGRPVAAVGYPAADPDRNDVRLMDEIFGGEYEVKRFSPGFTTDFEGSSIILTTDYTTLGGNSGSPVLDLETGEAVGLHFAGVFREINYAVASDIVQAASLRVRTMVPVVGGPPIETPTTTIADLSNRDGYDPSFLGCAERSVDLPALGPWADDAAPVQGNDAPVLKYRHFSVIQSKSRRLPLLTAVNIDGVQSRKLKRKGSWRLDGRIAPEHQIGNELYFKNPLDRGHMVRRRDPGWGDLEQAREGEVDTFHYTNCAPQHEDLNQKDWVGLEDYVLEAAETRDFKVSVFTGPVFRESDKRLRNQDGAEDIQVPEEFWKVVVMVNESTGELSATGYILSHGPMIRDMVESSFVFGQYETYQVQIAKIEAETGLDFRTLRSHDPFGAELSREAVFGTVARRIEGHESLVLCKPTA
ncbi:MAG: DNA/RNA non-specific endonuclease [Myxococcota bacterium]